MGVPLREDILVLVVVGVFLVLPADFSLAAGVAPSVFTEISNIFKYKIYTCFINRIQKIQDKQSTSFLFC